MNRWGDEWTGRWVDGRTDRIFPCILQDILYPPFVIDLSSSNLPLPPCVPDEVATNSTTDQQRASKRPKLEEAPLPPVPPVPEPTITLPPNWNMAKDAKGKCYYYNSVTRKAQWYPPALGKGSGEGTTKEGSKQREEEKAMLATAGPSKTLHSNAGEVGAECCKVNVYQ